MKILFQTLKAEILKNKRSPIVLSSFIAFGLAPVIGAVFIFMVQSPDMLAHSGGLAIKAKAMNFEANWSSYLSILSQAVGVGGVLVFGFVASWVFGREYAEGTAKDILSLPTSRTTIIHAKFMVYSLWCLGLAISNLGLALILGLMLGLPPVDFQIVSSHLTDYGVTTIMTILMGTPIAFFAVYGRGYLAPLGFVALTLVFAQVIAAAGFGYYFPWSIPGLFSGAGGDYKSQLNIVSYSILLLTALSGYLATLFYMKLADQTK